MLSKWKKQQPELAEPIHWRRCRASHPRSSSNSTSISNFTSAFSQLISLVLLGPCLAWCLNDGPHFADHATVPKGTNPTLYDAADFVVQLDELTFNDTVYCSQTVAITNNSSSNNGNGNGNLTISAAVSANKDEVTAVAASADAPSIMPMMADRCTSLVVEFYSDWCGHCRAYARVYKALARDLLGWSGVLKLAAINCADPINQFVCQASGISHYPFIKYYPRNSSQMEEQQHQQASVGHLLRSFQSLAQMRDQFTRAIVAEYEDNRYEDWPFFDWLAEVDTYGQLWEGIDEHIQTLVVVFESSQESLVGAQLLLDLSKYAGRIMARRCANNALAQALQIVDLPSFAVFRRGERTPIYIAELRRLLLNEFELFLHNETAAAAASPTGAARLQTFARRRGGGAQPQQQHEHFCTANPEICRRAYFVSESDMLKAARIALFNDIHLSGQQIRGRNLTALYNFVDALANHFPYSTRKLSGDETDDAADDGGQIQFLNASSRARVVFSHLRDFLVSKGAAAVNSPNGNDGISVDAWRAEFIRAELDQASPFPVAEGWEHCKGSSPVLRGFTCGLWTVFHTLTVNAYRKGQKDDHFHPIALLHSFRDWVGSFFACEHCRGHFLKMTTKVARIESLVRRREDVFLYLWRAHNMVNARLRGRETEDPQFPKYQFPPPFLCANCRRGSDGNSTTGSLTATTDFDEAKVRQFLLAYYADVRPIGQPREEAEVVAAPVDDDEEEKGKKRRRARGMMRMRTTRLR